MFLFFLVQVLSTTLAGTFHQRKLNCEHFQSQQEQDAWVASLFHSPNTPLKTSSLTFVELGASDGRTLSNTYGLEKCFDWVGLCIEPTDAYYNLLSSNRGQCVKVREAIAGDVRRTRLLGAQMNAENLSAGGTLWAGLEEHFESKSSITNGDEHGSIRSRDLSSQLAHDASEPVYVTTTTLSTVLDAQNFPKQMDYLSLDVEGAEYEILESFPHNERQFSVITVEHSYNQKEREKIKALLEANGYLRARCLGSDDGYVLGSLVVDENSVFSQTVIFDDRGCSSVQILKDCLHETTKEEFCSQYAELQSNWVACDETFKHYNTLSCDEGAIFHAFTVNMNGHFLVKVGPNKDKYEKPNSLQGGGFFAGDDFDESGNIFLDSSADVDSILSRWCNANFEIAGADNVNDCVSQMEYYVNDQLEEYHSGLKNTALKIYYTSRRHKGHNEF